MRKERLLMWTISLFLMVVASRAGLVCENTEFDYGDVFANDLVEHTFELKNTGTNAVEILKVRKTCGCVATVVSAKDVPPGGTAEIQVNVSLKGRSGEQMKVIYVHTDSPETPLLKLVTKGRVKRGVAPTVSPPSDAQAASAPVKSPEPRDTATPQAIPDEIRLPSTVGPDGLTISIEVKFPELADTRLKGIFLPGDLSVSVERSETGCWVELGPIRDVQALRGTALVILTSSGALRIPCIIEE